MKAAIRAHLSQVRVSLRKEVAHCVQLVDIGGCWADLHLALVAKVLCLGTVR